jgi:hypothetical protein
MANANPMNPLKSRKKRQGSLTMSFLLRKMREQGWLTPQREVTLNERWDMTQDVGMKTVKYLWIPVGVVVSSVWFNVPIVAVVTPLSWPFG